MTKYSIKEIGEKANRNYSTVDFEKWLERLIKYLKKSDKSFDEEKFSDWLDSDTEKPFISGKNRYYW